MKEKRKIKLNRPTIFKYIIRSLIFFILAFIGIYFFAKFFDKNLSGTIVILPMIIFMALIHANHFRRLLKDKDYRNKCEKDINEGTTKKWLDKYAKSQTRRSLNQISAIFMAFGIVCFGFVMFQLKAFLLSPFVILQILNPKILIILILGLIFISIPIFIQSKILRESGKSEYLALIFMAIMLILVIGSIILLDLKNKKDQSYNQSISKSLN